MKKSRHLFTDGWNSFCHFCFGICSKLFPVITPNFIIYQLIYYKDPNLFVDLVEFFIGLLSIVVMYYFLYLYKFEPHHPSSL